MEILNSSNETPMFLMTSRMVNPVQKLFSWLFPNTTVESLSMQAVVFSSVQFSCSVVYNSLWPHEPQHTRSPCPSQTPGVYQTHVHWVSDAIQPSHPLSSPSPPALNLSQHQGLFQWVSSSNQVAKVLEFSFNISPPSEHPGLIPLGWTGWISLNLSHKNSLGHEL